MFGERQEKIIFFVTFVDSCLLPPWDNGLSLPRPAFAFKTLLALPFFHPAPYIRNRPTYCSLIKIVDYYCNLPCFPRDYKWLFKRMIILIDSRCRLESWHTATRMRKLEKFRAKATGKWCWHSAKIAVSRCQRANIQCNYIKLIMMGRK